MLKQARSVLIAGNLVRQSIQVLSYALMQSKEIPPIVHLEMDSSTIVQQRNSADAALILIQLPTLKTRLMEAISISCQQTMEYGVSLSTITQSKLVNVLMTTQIQLEQLSKTGSLLSSAKKPVTMMLTAMHFRLVTSLATTSLRIIGKVIV
jgi:hypothetical protein